ncbi:hypothetical protein H4R21_004979, partial [Coemansia helicoidea]
MRWRSAGALLSLSARGWRLAPAPARIHWPSAARGGSSNWRHFGAQYGPRHTGGGGSGGGGGSSGYAFLVPAGIVGGLAVAVLLKQQSPLHSEAAHPQRAEASMRLQILHAQSRKTTRAMAAAKARVQDEASGQALGTRLVRLVAAEWWLFVGVALTAAGAAVVSLWTPVVTGDLINVIARSVRLVAAMDASVVEALRSPARKLLALFVANGLLTFAHTTLVTILGERIGGRLHAQAMDTLLWHDLAFFDSAQSGGLAARLSSDVAEFQSTFKKLVTQGLKSATLTAG